MTTFLALLTGGGLTAVGGVLSALATNWLGAKRDERTYAHEQALAREARTQERLDRAYQRLGEFLSYYRQWATSVRPFMGSVPTPDPPSNEELRKIETLVTNYGSREVRRLLDELGELIAKIRYADGLIETVDRATNVSAELDQEAGRERLAMIEYKKKLHQVSEAIRDQMHKELVGDSPAIEGSPGQREGPAIEGRPEGRDDPDSERPPEIADT
jgi:hypothetical protein